MTERKLENKVSIGTVGTSSIKGVALLAAICTVAGFAMTGCSSPGQGIKAGLVDPVSSAQQGSIFGNDDLDQRPSNPGFHDLTGS